jgi:ERCC4-type nuclease
LSDLVIVVDTRERYAYKFTEQQAATERVALLVGDYGVLSGDEVVAVVERKSLADLAKGLTDGSLFLQLADLARLPKAAVVVEDRYSRMFRHEYVSGGVLADAVARAQVRYPVVPIVFCETRRLAEEWTFRFLGAALAHHREQPSDPAEPRLWVE